MKWVYLCECQYENRCKDAFELQIFGLGILLEKHLQNTSKESILAVVNTTELVVEIRPEKKLSLYGF